MQKHKIFNSLKKLLELKINTYLIGPTGSGKSQLVKMVANDMGKEFYCQSVGTQTTMTHLMGYMDANGNYVTSILRQAYENGGIYLIDEIDAGNANVFTCINSALSNNYCSFPDKMVKKHDDFICVAAANTFGTGRDYHYIGRNHLDAATLDRFAFIGVGYDNDLQRKLTNNDEWSSRVIAIREVSEELAINVISSMRTAINGSVLLENNIPQEAVEKMLIWKGLEDASIDKIKSKLEAKEEKFNDMLSIPIEEEGKELKEDSNNEEEEFIYDANSKKKEEKKVSEINDRSFGMKQHRTAVDLALDIGETSAD